MIYTTSYATLQGIIKYAPMLYLLLSVCSNKQNNQILFPYSIEVDVYMYCRRQILSPSLHHSFSHSEAPKISPNKYLRI